MEQKKVKEILELCFSGKKENCVNGIDLRNKNLPTSLFRYRPLSMNNDYAIDEIMRDYYHLTSPSQYNDINDSEPIIFSYYKLPEKDIEKYTNFYHQHFAIDKNKLFQALNSLTYWDELISLLKNEIPDLDPKFFIKVEQQRKDMKILLNDKYRKLKEWYHDKIKICCFTESNQNTAMWSHYANQYKGVCIEYNTNLIKLVKNSKYSFFPVYYFDSLEDKNSVLYSRYSNFDVNFTNITCVYDSGRISNEIALKDYDVLEDIMRGVPFYKTTEWSYEREWRIVFYDRYENIPKNIPFLPIRAVYMGKDISIDNKNQLIALAEKKKILLYEMQSTPSGIKFIRV